MKQLIAYWKDLQHREQQMITLGGLFCVLAIIYFLIYQPINNSLISSEEKIKSQQALLTYLQASRVKISQLQANKVGDDDKKAPLSTQIEASFKKFNLVASSITQQKNNELQIRLDNVAFDKTLSWLIALTQKNIDIKSIAVDTTDEAGIVNVNVVLFR